MKFTESIRVVVDEHIKNPLQIANMAKKDFFVIRQDMLEKKYFFVITERRHAKSNNKQTPLSPNNEINKPTVGGISDGKELK